MQYNTIQRTTQYNTIQRNTTHTIKYNALHNTTYTTQHNTIQYNALHNTIQYNALHNTVQYNATDHNTIQLPEQTQNENHTHFQSQAEIFTIFSSLMLQDISFLISRQSYCQIPIVISQLSAWNWNKKVDLMQYVLCWPSFPIKQPSKVLHIFRTDVISGSRFKYR